MVAAGSPFDPARAHHPTRAVPLDRVIDLLNVAHAPERIREYRDAMARGERFPPVSVLALPGGRFVVTDGHKRLSAYRQLRDAPVLVELWPLRRLAADLLAQHRRFVRRTWRALGDLRGDAAQRVAARHHFATTREHTLRAVCSLLALARRRAPSPR